MTWFRFISLFALFAASSLPGCGGGSDGNAADAASPEDAAGGEPDATAGPADAAASPDGPVASACAIPLAGTLAGTGTADAFLCFSGNFGELHCTLDDDPGATDCVDAPATGLQLILEDGAMRSAQAIRLDLTSSDQGTVAGSTVTDLPDATDVTIELFAGDAVPQALDYTVTFRFDGTDLTVSALTSAAAP